MKKVGLIKKIWKLFFIKKLSKSLRNDLDPDPDFDPGPFFYSVDLRSGSGFASKLNGSLALGKEYPSYPPPPPVMT